MVRDRKLVQFTALFQCAAKYVEFMGRLALELRSSTPQTRKPSIGTIRPPKLCMQPISHLVLTTPTVIREEYKLLKFLSM